MKSNNTNLSIALAAALGASGTTALAENPFGMQPLDSGYLQIAETKTKDGKCGGDMKKDAGKMEDGKCGDDMKKAADKAKDGKCGEGKCGSNK